MANVLVIGRDRPSADEIRAILRQDGHDVTCTDAISGWQHVESDVKPELVVAAVPSPSDVLVDDSRDAASGFPAPLLFVLEGPRSREHPYMDDRLVDRIVTPYLDEELLARVDALVRVRRVVDGNALDAGVRPRPVSARLRDVGRRVVNTLTTGLSHRERPLEAYLEVAARVARWADRRDAYMPGHAERVTTLCAMMADALAFDDTETGTLMRAAMLHDIGKVSLPVEVLHQKSPLLDEQMRMIRTHPRKGAALIHELDPDDDVAEAILYHHERPDGFGYYGTDGDRVPRAARALAVAEVYDGMTSSSALRPLPRDEALDRLHAFRGVSLDSDCVEALVDRLGPTAGPGAGSIPSVG
ncbi:MAG TPA: HD domain-containing phosphohydrolase [Candidatus Polarisedimenticolaceae bacterium]|nr:HD domain-containing phosphohydrolase [Candidatus Polarisedimenticolaceae bacterium]